MSDEGTPLGRVAREVDDHYNILLDAALYGDVYQVAHMPDGQTRIIITSEGNA